MNILEELEKEFPNHKIELIKKTDSYNNYSVFVDGKELKVRYSNESLEAIKEFHDIDFFKELVHILKEEIKQHIK